MQPYDPSFYKGLDMAHYILIHGSWHGAWCWYKIAARLVSEGHEVKVPELPGRISNPARPIFVGLGHMVKSVAQYLPTDRKTTIVVHSRYGIIASQLAEAYPERIKRIIYVASFMIPSGKCVAEYFKHDKDAMIGPYIEVSKTGMWDRLNPKIFRECLYHDCSDEDNMLGKLLLGKEPLRPAITKLKLTSDKYGQIPRAYIRLTQDRAVSLSLQDRLINETQVSRVESVEASHSAYFSKPDELTQTILKLSMT